MSDAAQVDERTFFDLAQWMEVHDRLAVPFMVLRLKNDFAKYTCSGGDHCVACGELIEKWLREDQPGSPSASQSSAEPPAG